MTLHPLGHRPLTKKEADELFWALFEDDTEDAPWMVMGSPQWDATVDLYGSLREHARLHQPTWFVAGMLPIRFTRPGFSRRGQLAPDIFVALVPDRPRSSYDADAEGFPAFVLEVVSPSSEERDLEDKRYAYERLGAREYALFSPKLDRPSELSGYRRTVDGEFEPRPKDAEGRLWSDVLGLYLLVRGASVRAVTSDGQLLLTLREAQNAYRAAESENERLRREVEEFRRRLGGEGGARE